MSARTSAMDPRSPGARRSWAGDMGDLLVGGVIGGAGYGLLALVVVAAALSLLGGLGLPLLVRAVELTQALADVQRRRIGEPVGPYPPLPSALLPKVRTIRRTPATWRDLVWLALPVQVLFALLVTGLFIGGLSWLVLPVNLLLDSRLHPGQPPEVYYFNIPITSLGSVALVAPIGITVIYLTYRLPRTLAPLETALARWLLSPTRAARLTARVERLTETRSDALDASAVELQRIERDLHDGAQARLVAVAMNLGVAEDLFDTDPGAARAMLADARASAHAAMAELRSLVRGIRPPLLADRGLDGALRAVALDSPVPVDLELRLRCRLAPPLESAVYFTVLEAVTNAVKHSGAGRLTMTVSDVHRRLVLRVTDDGRGGADPACGTGLRGIARRLATFDAELCVTSPVGGPTVVEAQLPCGC